MKNLFLLFLLFPFLSFSQEKGKCLFPFSTDVDSALVQVWLTAKPGLDLAQVAKIRRK